MFKNIDITACTVTVTSLLSSLPIDGTHECDEFAWDDPVYVSILHLFVVLVLFNVELVKDIPAHLYTEFKAFQAMFNCAFVVALTLAGVSIGTQQAVVRTECLPGLACSLAKDHNHIGSDQECAICKFDVVVGGLSVVVDFYFTLELIFFE